MQLKPYSPEAYRLLNDGAVALARMEHNGIRVDTKYLTTALAKVTEKVASLEAELKATDVWREWRKHFAGEANLSSRPQLAHVLFEVMGYQSPGLTASGRHKADGESLEAVEHPFIPNFVLVEKLKKAHSTYLMGTLNELSDDGRIRAFYNLHLAMTFRSSCENTNIQNQPVRDPLLAKIIRRMYLPSPGCRLVESDFSAIEVRVACAYHHDPTMMKYIFDNYDMHRDMAAECFMLPTDAIPKMVRHVGKNSFVFPEFYGDVDFSVAQGLWAAAVKNKLTTQEGVPLLAHLASKGILSLGDCDPDLTPRVGTFEKHIQAVEHGFWKRRFRVYDQWKNDWYATYKTKGWFQMLSGFTLSGSMRKNVVINAPVQGAAFHCCLWSIIEINRELNRRKMRSKLVAEIHDSILGDVPEEEFDEYCSIVHDVMTRRVREHFTWINVPIAIEIEACNVGETWWHKKPVPLPV